MTAVRHRTNSERKALVSMLKTLAIRNLKAQKNRHTHDRKVAGSNPAPRNRPNPLEKLVFPGAHL